MTKIPIDDVLRVLRFAPQGMTTAEVAERLGSDNGTVAGRLSKLALYGKIERDWERTPTGPFRRWCRWRMREGAHA